VQPAKTCCALQVLLIQAKMRALERMHQPGSLHAGEGAAAQRWWETAELDAIASVILSHLNSPSTCIPVRR
jgi:hypothetical protein